MDKIKVKNIFTAVSEKSLLDPLLTALPGVRPSKPAKHLRGELWLLGGEEESDPQFWGTEGTVKYLKSRGFNAQSIVKGFDFDGRVKTLQKEVFARILADRTNPKHLKELKKLKMELWSTLGVSSGSDSQNTSEVSFGSPEVNGANPFDLVIVDLYPPDEKIFPESMDIGGQTLIRAAVKNYKSVALAFDAKSLASLVGELAGNNGSTTLNFRKTQAKKALKFIAERCKIETNYF